MYDDIVPKEVVTVLMNLFYGRDNISVDPDIMEVYRKLVDELFIESTLKPDDILERIDLDGSI